MRVLGHVPTKCEILMRKGCDFADLVEVEDDEPLPDGTTITLYVYSRDSSELIGFWPFVEVEAGGGQIQIYADDHEIIPDGAKFTVILEKPGFPKTPWYEGRVSKVNR